MTQNPASGIINLFNETNLDVPINEKEAQNVLSSVSVGESRSFNFVELVYVDEEGIIDVNRKYLNRDYVTDIISFHYTEDEAESIEGTLYCCAPRIFEQAKEFEQPVKTEFFRILVHGLLHLIGYDDQTESEIQLMHGKENYYLNLLKMPYEE